MTLDVFFGEHDFNSARRLGYPRRTHVALHVENAELSLKRSTVDRLLITPQRSVDLDVRGTEQNL